MYQTFFWVSLSSSQLRYRRADSGRRVPLMMAARWAQATKPSLVGMEKRTGLPASCFRLPSVVKVTGYLPLATASAGAWVPRTKCGSCCMNFSIHSQPWRSMVCLYQKSTASSSLG